MDSLPDDVIIHILKWLSSADIKNIYDVNQRFRGLSCDRLVARRADFEGCYSVTEDWLKTYIGATCSYIQYLSFNHCHWLPQRALQSAIFKCKQLQELHVIECRLRVETLTTLLRNCCHLVALSFSISSFSEMKKDIYCVASRTLLGLKRLHLYFSSTELKVMTYLGEHATLIDYCHSLEELHISSASMAVPELYRPIISKPANHQHLQAMTITSNIHAGAQMFFYGTLSQLPNSTYHWRSLMMPNVNFVEFQRKAEFKDCLKYLDKLKHLDMSGSRVTFPNDFIHLEGVTELVYLSLRQTIVDSPQLSLVASHCTKLTSLNLLGCFMACTGANPAVVDLEGLRMLFCHCKNLKHLNLADIHIHQVGSRGEETTSQQLLPSGYIKGLISVALPGCILYNKPCLATSTATSTSHTGPVTKKRRIAISPCSAKFKLGEIDGSLQGSAMGTLQGAAPCLLQLTDNNPDLQELELMGVKFESVIHKNKFVRAKQQQHACSELRLVGDAELENIARWQWLQKLTLAALPGVVNGSFLASITAGCVNLQSLSLAHIGVSGNSRYSAALCQALPLATKLLDLRLEQPHLPLSTNLFAAISHCTRLQRLCVLAKHSQFQHHDVLSMADKCSHLVVLQLFTGNTLTACKTLTTNLNRRFGKDRPAWSVTLFPLLHDSVADVVRNIPAGHLEGITRFESRVCMKPAE